MGFRLGVGVLRDRGREVFSCSFYSTVKKRQGHGELRNEKIFLVAFLFYFIFMENKDFGLRDRI